MQNRLREYRLAAGLSIEKLHEKANVASSHISEIENGKVESLGFVVAMRLAKALGVRVDELFYLDDDEAAAQDEPDGCMVA